ncbi:uncharacterized protein LOC135205708 [Macrobrachium nipponense]|uniref:uncharacterized protein LOC135205708 n=1 Tax=Macrobrachium nipponense TaxID=159736 RepID=UPI0030C83FE9
MAASGLDSAFQMALREEVVIYDREQNGFECVYCEVKLTGEESTIDHLKSKLHRENGARFAIMNLERSPSSIKALLPEVVIAAVKAGDISVIHSNEILCHVCNSPNSGVVSLEAHLSSKNHLKKKNAGAPVRTPTLDASPSLIQNYTSKDPDVDRAVREETVLCNNSNDFLCVPCDLRFNGEKSLKQHLDCGKHEEACAKLVIRDITKASSYQISKLPEAVRKAAREKSVLVTDSEQLLCTICGTTVGGITPLNDHLVGSDHRRKSLLLLAAQSSRHTPESNGVSSNIAPHSTTMADGPSSQATNAIIAAARDEGIIDETDNALEKFSCKCCNKNFNNEGPLLDHLKSKNHSKKKKLYLESRSLTVPPPDHQMEASPSNSSPLNLNYSVISDVRGHVYVFNYSFKKTQKARIGAEHDSNRLSETFSKMGYEVFLHEDLTRDETIEHLDKIRKKPELNEIDSFIMFFLSHGLDAYTFLANDEGKLDLRLIRRKFTDRRCPYLRGKPKIFMVNYCRGDQMQKKDDTEFDDIEVPNDMATIHAAAEGVMAKRNRTSGTIFVASLCKVLRQHARDLNLKDIYTVLHEEMRKNNGTKPMWEDYGFKNFKFNPADS